MKHLFRFTFVLYFAILGNSIYGQTIDYQPSAENLKARQWFQDAKFGLFIHWGVYSNLSDGEWVMRYKNITVKEYENLPNYFYPNAYDPTAWVKMAKAAGMKYITITTRHHDGFSMFDSKVSDYNIVKKTPYKKDILAPLAEACRKEGIKLCFYYSHLDWHHPDYYPRGNTGFNNGCMDWSGRPQTGNWDNYLKFMNDQLTELLTNYGDIAAIWFDGFWDKKDADWKLRAQYDLIHKLQPACMVGNNHHLAVKPGEDFQMFEKDLPGKNTSGFGHESKIGDLPLEMCETMNGAWGYNLKDNKFKSSKTLIKLLVKNAGLNSNFLLNVGPQPDGKIQKEFVDTLAKVGQWTSVYGNSIYGTRGGVIPEQSWGVVTANDKEYFIHILEKPEADWIFVPIQNANLKSLATFPDGQVLESKSFGNGFMLNIAKLKSGTPDLVLKCSKGK